MRRIRTGLAATALVTLGLVGFGSAASATEPVPKPGQQSGTVAAGGGGTPPQLVRCLRAQGVRTVQPGGPGKSTIVFQPGKAAKRKAVARACGAQAKPDVKRAAKARKFVRCIRDNGVPELPSPGPDGLIRVSAQSDVDPGDRSLVIAQERCARVA